MPHGRRRLACDCSKYSKTTIRNALRWLCLRVLQVKSIVSLHALLLLAMLMPQMAWAFAAFEVKDIRIEGLQRISVGTVFNYLPITAGETVDNERAAEAVHSLFKTGFFNDVRLTREDNVLVVKVAERPAIANITITGNKDITTEQLTTALDQIGLAKGRVFDRSLLDKVEQELQRQYFSRGKYAVKIDSKVIELERNRVDVTISIAEGQVAKIVQINIVGNENFSDKQLLDQMQLDPDALLAFFTSSDQYSKPKLTADLETIRSYYLDRGYINFAIDSTQVSITPDKKAVYITINITEGDHYSISNIKLAGDLIVSAKELRSLIAVTQGEVFSRRLITESAQAIGERLGKEGYAFANVNTVPDINKANKTVELTFFIDPGKRVYVRRININGNSKTQDEVLRREIRQMESAWISTEKVNRSRERLQRLSFIEDVNVETPPVPGVEDQVDLNINVTERSAGSLQAGLGYSPSQGVLLNASVSHNNFLGSGKRISAEINNSDVNTIYSFSYTNPYYTLDGISRGFRGYFRTQNAALRNTASYNSDTYGFDVNYGIPLGEFQSSRIGLGYENKHLKQTPSTPVAFRNFISSNREEFALYKLSSGWSYDTRNRTIFANKGILQTLSLEATLPGSELDFYILSSRSLWYKPLTKSITLSLNADLGIGEKYGDTTELPFFEHFFAGGGRTVRGYRPNSLGPKEGSQALGGALKTTGNMELIFPVPFADEIKSLRLSAFFDIGNVYADLESFDASELRYSAGLSATWLSPIGPFVVSFGKALNEQLGDSTEVTQVSIGAPL